MSREYALTHNEANAILGDYIANELPEQMRVLVEQHLSTCEFCQIDYREILRIYRLLGTVKVSTEQTPPLSLADAVLMRLDTASAYASDDLDALLAGANDEFSKVQQSEENTRPLYPAPGVLTTESNRYTQNRYGQEKRYTHMNNEKKSYGNERTYRMESHTHTTKRTRNNTLWLTLVAVLVLAIVAGSLFAFRTALFGGHNNGPTRPGISTPVPKSTQTAKPLPTPTPTQVASSQILPTQTDCPPDGTARAAVMPAITLGTDPNIFYATNTLSIASANNALTINRYDVATGQTTQVISIPLNQLEAGHEGWNPDARLSNDGQWIVFHGITGSQDAIQMVRVDGQELQTLYCGKVDSMLLSPDQKTLAFNLSYGNLEMLDMDSGKLQTDYSNHTASGMNPMYYEPLKWYTNSSLYVKQQLVGVGGTRTCHIYNFELALVKDTTLDSNSQTTNFQNMFSQQQLASGVGVLDPCSDFDINQNRILISNPVEKDTTTNSNTITIQTLDGNASTIYTDPDPNNAIRYARFASSTKILFFTLNSTLLAGATYPTSQNVTAWEINTDGTGLTQIATFPDNSQFNMDQISYTPSYIASRDGSQYAVYVGSFLGEITDANGLFFGNVQGGSVTQIPGTKSMVLIGWSNF
jgi:hypothetical protein